MSVCFYVCFDLISLFFIPKPDYLFQLAVHMKQVDGLCSPAAKTSKSYQEIQVGALSSLTVSFPAVPMALGSIPIIIQLYDREHELGVDAIQKTLSVQVIWSRALLHL